MYCERLVRYYSVQRISPHWTFMSNNLSTRRWDWMVLKAEEKSKKNIAPPELPILVRSRWNTEVLIGLEWHPQYCDIFGTRIASGLIEAQLSLRTSLSQTFIGTDVRAVGIRSFMQYITGFLGTVMIHDFFRIVGIDRLLKHII